MLGFLSVLPITCVTFSPTLGPKAVSLGADPWPGDPSLCRCFPAVPEDYVALGLLVESCKARYNHVPTTGKVKIKENRLIPMVYGSIHSNPPFHPFSAHSHSLPSTSSIVARGWRDHSCMQHHSWRQLQTPTLILRPSSPASGRCCNLETTFHVCWALRAARVSATTPNPTWPFLSRRTSSCCPRRQRTLALVVGRKHRLPPSVPGLPHSPSSAAIKWKFAFLQLTAAKPAASPCGEVNPDASGHAGKAHRSSERWKCPLCAPPDSTELMWDTKEGWEHQQGCEMPLLNDLDSTSPKHLPCKPHPRRAAWFKAGVGSPPAPTLARANGRQESAISIRDAQENTGQVHVQQSTAALWTSE